jgi:hypothetical protein
MVLRLEVVGLEDVVKLVKGINTGFKGQPTKMTQKMGSAFRKRVKKNIPRPKYSQGPNHNTPTSMLHRLAPTRKTVNGHVVRFRKMAEDGNFDLPSILEFGAKPHRQPNNPIWKGRIHPGTINSSATGFWSKSVKEFQAQDMDRIIDESVRKIVDGRGK